MKQPVLPAQFEEVARNYRIRDPNVESFLRVHPEIMQLLLEARPHIERHFGMDTVVNLQLWHEYGWPKDEMLAAEILTLADPHTAGDLLNGVYDDWWTEASGRPGAWLLGFTMNHAGDPETIW